MTPNKMTIDEVIKELREDREHPTADFMPKLKAADQLGIEGLERLKELRGLVGIDYEVDWEKAVCRQLPSESPGKRVEDK